MAGSSNPPKMSRFGDNFLKTLMALEAASDEVEGSREGGGDYPEVMEEHHLDCQGRQRLFRLRIYGGGVATFLTATEIMEGDEKGMRLLMRFNEDTEPPPYGEIREKIEERLATRDLVRDPNSGNLVVLNGLIRAQITCDPDSGSEFPLFLIDGEEITWEEMGRLLMTYEGWGLRIKITEE